MEFSKSQKLENTNSKMEFRQLEIGIFNNGILTKEKKEKRIIKTHSTTNTEANSSSYQIKNYQQQN